METLLTNLKNEVSSHQKFMPSVKKSRKNWIVNQIKKNYLDNCADIRNFETELNKLLIQKCDAN
jgi:hypothetical protein